MRVNLNKTKLAWFRSRRFIFALRIALSLLPLLLILPDALGVRSYEAVAFLDQRLYDWRLRFFNPPPKHDERIVIVDIDDKSLKELGRWPWHRDVLAQLLKELADRQHAAAIGFDVVFAEPEKDQSLKTVEEWLHTAGPRLPPAQLDALRKLMDHDAILARAMQDRPVVLGYYFSTEVHGSRTGELPPPLSVSSSGATRTFPGIHSMEGYSAPLKTFTQSALSSGFINAIADSDGVLRSVPIVARRGAADGKEQYYPSLTLALLMAAMHIEQINLAPVDSRQTSGHAVLAGLDLLQGGSRLRIPTDTTGNVLVPYRSAGGPEAGRFTYVSALDVVQGKLTAGQLDGRIVLVGTTVPGLRDLRSTPVNEVYPGVEVHASVLADMLDGQFIHTPDYARGYSVLVLIVAVAILLFILPKVSLLGSLGVLLGIMAAVIGLNSWLYVKAGLALPLARSLLVLFFTHLLYTLFGYFTELRTKSKLVELFGHYVPADLVARMASQPEAYSMDAQSRELTVMFCDVRNFTGLAETMEPVQLQNLLNDLFNRMSQVIAAHMGTIDKYIGDCVMVFWGAPVNDPQHAMHAIQTADGILSMLQQFNHEQMAQGLPEIRVGIGINSGVVSVGDMGSSLRRNYTVIGDAVNLAARLESLCKLYGVQILAGPHTVELNPQVHWQWVDKARVTGKSVALDIYQPRLDYAGREEEVLEAQLWSAFREAFLQQDWSQADKLLMQLIDLQPDQALYHVYRLRVEALALHTPGEWDGTWTQLHKDVVDVQYLA